MRATRSSGPGTADPDALHGGRCSRGIATPTASAAATAAMPSTHHQRLPVPEGGATTSAAVSSTAGRSSTTGGNGAALSAAAAVRGDSCQRPSRSSNRPVSGGRCSSRQVMRRSPTTGASGFSALPRPSPSGWKVAAMFKGSSLKAGRNGRHSPSPCSTASSMGCPSSVASLAHQRWLSIGNAGFWCSAPKSADSMRPALHTRSS